MPKQQIIADQTHNAIGASSDAIDSSKRERRLLTKLKEWAPVWGSILMLSLNLFLAYRGELVPIFGAWLNGVAAWRFLFALSLLTWVGYAIYRAKKWCERLVDSVRQEVSTETKHRIIVLEKFGERLNGIEAFVESMKQDRKNVGR